MNALSPGDWSDLSRRATSGFTATLPPEYLSEGLVVELAVRCAPGTLHDTAVALAARADTRSVEIATGAPEVFAEFLLPDHDALLTAIDGSVGRIPGVVDIHSSVVLRLLLTANDWAPYDDEPTLVRRRLVEGSDLPEPLDVDALDRRLVELLKRDARMPMAGLAGELCVGESTARRRLARLMRSHSFPPAPAHRARGTRFSHRGPLPARCRTPCARQGCTPPRPGTGHQAAGPHHRPR
ncbi:AsnC family transcriptional regulator [Streptomyces sp. GTA36]